MANYFQGYSGSKATDSSGATIKSVSPSTKGVGGKSSFFKGYSGAAYDPNYQAPTPAPKPVASKPPNFGVFGQFASPFIEAGKGIIKSTAQALGTPVELARAGVAAATGNQGAKNAALQRAGTDVGAAADIARAPLQAATRIGLSLAHNPFSGNLEEHLLGADRTYTPNNPVAKALLGNAPIDTYAHTFNQDTKQNGVAHGLGSLAVAALGDYLAGKGAKAGGLSAKGVIDNHLNSAISNYAGMRTQAALGHLDNLPKDQLGLPGGEKPLGLPATSAANPVKTTPGPNGGTFGGGVSPETAAKIQKLDTVVQQHGTAGPKADTVSQLGTLNAMRVNAAHAVQGLVNDRVAEMKATPTLDLAAKAGRPSAFPATDAELAAKAHSDLSTGQSAAALHYQHAVEVAHAADVSYRAAAKDAGPLVNDVAPKDVAPEKVAAARAELAAAHAQAAAERSGMTPTNYVPPAVHVAPETLKSTLEAARAGNAPRASEIQILNDLISHPGVSSADKSQYILDRESLKPGAAPAEPAPAAAPATAPVAPTAAAQNVTKPVAFDYVPPEGEGAPAAPAAPSAVPPNGLSNEELLVRAAKNAGPESKAGGAISEIRNAFNPAPGAEGAAVKNDLRAGVGDLEVKKAQMAMGTKGEVKFWSKQKPVDNLNFIQKMESGQPQATPELDAKAAAFKDWFQQDYKMAQGLKEDLPYFKNYFTHNGLWKDPQKAGDFFERWMKPTLGGKPGALEHRSFPTIIDGLRAGLEIKETNPQVLANSNRASLLRARMAQDFQEEAAARGYSPHTVQRVLDRYLDRGFKDASLYQSTRQVGNTLNSAQLSLSGFHVTGTSINSVVSQFSNGLNDILRLHPVSGVTKVVTAPFAPLRNILQGGKILSDFKKGNITSDIKNIAEGGGRIGQPVYYKATGLSKSLEQIQSGNAGEAAKGVVAAPIRALSAVSKPVMEWWVPRLKLGATKDLIDSKLMALKDASPEVRRAAKAEAVDSIDNRFGQLIHDNLFWDQHIKDMTHLLMRSPGWNIGTVRELGGGGANFLKPSTYVNLAKGKGLPENSAYTLSLAAGAALMGGTLQYLYTGTWPTSVQDYFYPRTGKTDKNGNPERVSLPTYAKDVFSFLHNPAQTVINKANPAISEVAQLASNKDYFGNEIRNPNDSLGTQVGQVGTYLKNANLPFSVTNTNQRVDKTLGTATQSFFGISPAPGYITKSPFEQKISDALNHALGSKSLTPEEEALIQAKSQAKQASRQGDGGLIDQLVQSGKITKKQGENLKASAKGTSIQNTFNYLLTADRQAAANLLDSASPADLRQLGDPKSIRTLMYKSLRSRNSSPELVAASKQILNKIGH